MVVNLARLLIIAAIIWLVVYALRRMLHHLTPPQKTTASPGAAKNMVRCAQCGLHIPESEAIAEQGQYFCSQEHRRRHSTSV